MKRVVIPTVTPLTPNQEIHFDLQDVLRAIGRRALESRWSCSNLHCVTRGDREIDVLARAGDAGPGVAGAELVNGLDDVLLTLSGELVATDANGCRWAVVWVDNARIWEVWTDDESVLRAVASRFEASRVIP